jgi:UDP-glucose 4-epimerase
MANLKPLRCVVFGGGGFLGTNLCLALAGRVERLRAFDRRLSFPDAMREIEFFPGDFGDVGAVASAIEGCDTVFHLVGGSTPASANVDKISDLQSSVANTLHLLEACRAEGVRRVVFVSSGGTVYGIPERIPTPETAATDPITAYGISKLAVEKYLALYEHLYGLEYRVVRLANPYGPFQTAIRNQGVVCAFLRRALHGEALEVWGDGSVVRDYLYVDDVIKALEAVAVHEGPGRVFNIGSGEGLSLKQIIAAIESLLGKPVDVRWQQGRPIDVPRSILHIGRAADELGWQPGIGFGDGLERTAAWLRTAAL